MDLSLEISNTSISAHLHYCSVYRWYFHHLKKRFNRILQHNLARHGLTVSHSGTHNIHALAGL